jgi:hypothetical protein
MRVGTDWAKRRAGRLLCEQPQRPKLEISAVNIEFPRESAAPYRGIGFALSNTALTLRITQTRRLR